MSESVDPKTNQNTKPLEKSNSTNDEPQSSEDIPDVPDYQAAYAQQFEEEEENHWADSYGDGDEEPPSRGGQHVGTVKTGGVTPKPPPKNNP